MVKLSQVYVPLYYGNENDKVHIPKSKKRSKEPIDIVWDNVSYPDKYELTKLWCICYGVDILEYYMELGNIFNQARYTSKPAMLGATLRYRLEQCEHTKPEHMVYKELAKWIK